MIDMLNLIIFYVPPSMNSFTGTGNTKNKNYIYQSIKKDWAQLIYFASRNSGWRNDFKPMEKATIEIKYFFKDNIRRDPDNYAGKFINDGLVSAGIIKDDTFDVIDLHVKMGGKKCAQEKTEISIVRRD